MATFSDPLTDTEWVDTDDPSGSITTSIVAVIGLGILFTMMAVARATVVPVVGDVVSMIPGIDSGSAGSGGMDFDFGGGGL
jgi:hypothetical protein